MADSETAGLLFVATGTPILRQTCIAFGRNGHIVFYEDLLRIGSITFERYVLRREVTDVLPRRGGENA